VLLYPLLTPTITETSLFPQPPILIVSTTEPQLFWRRGGLPRACSQNYSGSEVSPHHLFPLLISRPFIWYKRERRFVPMAMLPLLRELNPSCSRRNLVAPFLVGPSPFSTSVILRTDFAANSSNLSRLGLPVFPSEEIRPTSCPSNVPFPRFLLLANLRATPRIASQMG